jgi:hypothetical protein
MDLYRFSVKADPATGNGIGLLQLTLNIATSTTSVVAGTTTVRNLNIYAYTDAGFSTPVSSFTNGLISTYNSGNGLLTGASTDYTVATTTGLVVLPIPAGSTYYFRVVGDVALTAGSGTFSGSITTKLVGDSAYPVPEPTLMQTANAVSASKLVWSPNATTTSGITGNDWTNGYYVSGLPSTGMDSQTISKYSKLVT